MSSKVGKGAEKARITPTKITSAYNSQALQETTHIKMKKKKMKMRALPLEDFTWYSDKT